MRERNAALHARALALFAKAPRPGEVKTRLIPVLGAEAAAKIAAAFVADSGENVVQAARRVNAVPFLFCAPPAAIDTMRAFVSNEMMIRPQSVGNLGTRLIAAHTTLIAEGFRDVCFVGADSPTMPRPYVDRAFLALDDGYDLALGPADDGGYYLIALRALHRSLFENIDWSTSRVYEQTVLHAQRLGLSFHALPTWYDVDDAASLSRLRRELCDRTLADGEGLAPRTRALLSSLGLLS
ncbi:MAG: TIGR04282 family arsenosugar biosynthesis glycosyltransferase [Vulcanimicrobiaceae bacterium]